MLHRRRRVEVGAQRQCAAHQPRRCRANTSAATKAAASPTTARAWRATDSFSAAQSGWYAQGVYQFMPEWRVGLRYDRSNVGNVDAASNNASLYVPAYSPTRTTLMLDWSPSEFSRVRLQIRQRPRALRPDRQPVHPAVPDEPGRARRAQLLIQRTPMQRLLSDRRGAAASRSISPRGPRRAQGARLRTRMGRAGAGAGRRQGQRLRRHHRLAGPAPHPGAAEPDRRGAQHRPAGVHRRRAGGRLAAAADPPVGQQRDPAGQAGQFRGRGLRAQARGARRGWTAPTATCTPLGNPHIQTDPRNIALVAEPLARRLAELDPANAASYQARAGRLHRALEGGHRALGASRRRR